MKKSTPQDIRDNGRFMKLLKMKRVWIAAILGSALIMVCAIQVQLVSASQDDACQVISLSIAERIAKGDAVTPELVDETISRLIRASVINGRVDAEGKPADYNGREFLVDVGDGIVTTSTRRALLHPFESRAAAKINR
jgi:hypothetical protein